MCSQQNPLVFDPAAPHGAAEWQAYLQAIGCAGVPYTPPNPAVLAQQALATIGFPHPSGHRSPSETLLWQGFAFTYGNLPTFYWTDPGTWVTLSATASDRGVAATVTATPVSLTYSAGDGGRAVCPGPGRPWEISDGNGPPTNGACAYEYARVTPAPITATETLTWRVTWVGTGVAAGQLDAVSTSTSGQLRVLQVQTVNR